MNNWRLLLFAVVAVLQPIGSFTETNLIDGREECCNQRPNSVTQDTSLYGTYRKTNSEDRRLNNRITEDIPEERRYQARNDPITRSRQIQILERNEIRTSPSVRSIEDSRITKNQDRHQPISFGAKVRQTRDSNVLDSRRIIMSRDERTDRRDSLEIKDSRRVQKSVDLRHASTNRETMAVLRREREHVAREGPRDSRISAFRSATNIQLDNSRERHLDHRAREIGNVNRRSEILDSRLNNINEQEDLRRVESRDNRRNNIETNSERVDERRRQDERDSYDKTRTIRHDDHRCEVYDTTQQVDRNRREIRENHNKRNVLSRVESPVNRRRNNKGISERVDERRQRNEKDSNDRVSTIRRDLSERISADRWREYRDTIELVARIGRKIRENHNERNNEHRQQQDENRLSREKSSMLRESRLNTAAARESRIITDARSERIVTNNNRNDVRRQTSRNILASTDITIERRQDSRVSRTIEATLRNERLVRSDERKDKLREPLTGSLDRFSVLRSSSVSRSIQREFGSRNLAQLLERNVRDDRGAKYGNDLRSVEKLDKRRGKRDESRMSRDRTTPMLHDNRDSRNSVDQLQEFRSVEILSRINVIAHRESKIQGDIRESVRYENRREREERRALQKQNLRRMARDTERRVDRKFSGTSRFIAHTSSNERTPGLREDTRSERLEVRREARDENVAPMNRIQVQQRLTRDISTSQQRLDNNRASRNAERSARLQRTRSLDGIGDEKREVPQSDDNRAIHYSLDRFSRLSKERIEDQRRVVRQTTKDSRVDARNDISRNRRDVRIGERFEIRRQQHESRFDSASSEHYQSRDDLVRQSVERRSQKIAPRDGEMNTRSERFSKNRDDRKITERDVAKNILKSQESRRITTDEEVQANRHNLAMERMSRVAINANRGIRMEAKPSDAGTSGNVDMDTKRDAASTRFRNFAAKIREMDSSDETTENQHSMTWQMVFYTLQVAYVCGFLMQMLNEKSNTGKSRKFTWWAFSSKDLVKVD